ncbi:MAG: response regulator transcription factor [Candidatus Sulfotelmatobacter sp.]
MISGQILIVDDNEAVRKSLRSLLSSRPGWKVCGEAVDGLDAIEKAKSLRPDIVLMDISMPRMNGLEVARAIRQELADAKILIMSQHDPASLLPSAIQAGANGCVDKSQLATDLLSSIESLVGSAQARGIANSD